MICPEMTMPEARPAKYSYPRRDLFNIRFANSFFMCRSQNYQFSGWRDFQSGQARHCGVALLHLQLGTYRCTPLSDAVCPTNLIFYLRASYRNRGAQLALIFAAAAALGRFASLGASHMATRFTFFTSDPACLEPWLCPAYSWPSVGATCAGSLPR
jgi:hypothetical protein